MGYTLTWVSKLQAQILLSNMEGDYISLSQSIREIISVREILNKFKLLLSQETPENTLLQHMQENFVYTKFFNLLFMRTMNPVINFLQYLKYHLGLNTLHYYITSLDNKWIN